MVKKKPLAISKLPSLIVIGGVPGTGKTTLAQQLQQHMGEGTIILDIDEQRRIYAVEVMGADYNVLDPRTNLDKDIYHTPEVTMALLDYMQDKASKALAEGTSVLMVSPMMKPERRAKWEKAALDANAEFSGIFLTSDKPEMLLERTRIRQQQREHGVATLNHFSEGGPEVLQKHFLNVPPGEFSASWKVVDIGEMTPDMLAEKVSHIIHRQSGKENTPDMSFLKHYDHAREIADQNMLVRLIYCAFNDQILPAGDVRFEITEQHSDHPVVLSNMPESFDYLYSRDPDQRLTIVMHAPGGDITLTDPSQFWDNLKPYAQAKLADKFDESNWEVARYGMLHTLNTDALSVAKRLDLKAHLATSSGKDKTLWKWITTHYTPGETALDTLFTQMGSFTGNQNHPLSKLRRHVTGNKPMTDDEQVRYFSEYANSFPMPLAAVDRNVMHLFQQLGHEDYAQFFREHYPQAYDEWQQYVKQQGKEPENYIPVPVHPMNVPVMRKRLQQWVDSGQVMMTQATLEVHPTISTRSLRPVEGAAHFKTTLPDIQITGSIRELGRKGTCRAPAYSQLFESIVDDNKGFGDTLRIVGEPYGMCFNPNQGAADALEKPAPDADFLSAMVRQDPIDYARSGEYVMPLATALCSLGKDAKTGAPRVPLLGDIMRENGVSNAEQALDYFKQYADTVLTGQLGLFARYGVSLEAHQQNTYLAFDRGGKLNATIVQDLATGASIYRKMLETNKKYADYFDTHPHRPLLTSRAYDDMKGPLQQVIHTTLKSHLLPVAAIVCKEFGVDKQEVMRVIRDGVTTTLQSAEQDYLPTLKAKEQETFRQNLRMMEKALLKDPTLDLAMLTMHITQTYDKVRVLHPNSLQGWVQP